jgi:hypothetical protein
VQTSGSEVVDEELVGSIATGGFSAVAIENGAPEPTRPLLRFKASRTARNATEPAPVLWPDQSRDLFDVVIVVARHLNFVSGARLSIVHCLLFSNEVCGWQRLEFGRVCDSYQLNCLAL